MQAGRLAAAADPKGDIAAVQRQTAVAILRARPADASAWVRMAVADSLAHRGRLSAEGARALDTSYAMSAYAGPRAGWRIAFALQHWDDLGPETQADALTEIRLVRSDDAERDDAEARAKRISNVSGVLTALITGLIKMKPGG